MANTPDAIAEILKGALASFDSGNKWCTHTFKDGRGRMCAQGAVIEHMHPQWDNKIESAWTYVYGDCAPVIDVLYNNIPRDLEPWFDVGGYNNSRRSFGEIREWFEQAIASVTPKSVKEPVPTIDIDELLGEASPEAVTV